MSSEITPGVTVTEVINDDGSKTVTTVTIHEDGSKSTKRKTIRPKRSKSPAPRSKSPVPRPAAASTTAGTGSMEDALEDALSEHLGGHQDNEAFEKAVRRCIPSEFVLIASQDDESQAQEAHFATKLFNLPYPAGDAGSVATSALVQLLYQNPDRVVGTGTPISCLELIQKLNVNMKKATTFDIRPQISASRPLGPPRLGRNQYAPFYIVPPGYSGKRRALLVGINFVDDVESKRLKSPHNDVHNMQQFLETHCGFANEDIIVLKDGGEGTAPTKQNILDGFQKMIDSSQANDVVFIQYSGHGGRVKDTSGDEGDGYDSYILPLDYKTVGQILDDDILKDLIKAMPAGVYTTMLVDCCNSGTVGDLPYVLKPDTPRDQEIERFFDTDTRQEILEKEAQAGQEQEDWKRAKAERKKQRELRKKQQEEEQAAGKVKAGQDAALMMQQVAASGSPTMQTQAPATMMYSQAPPTMQNFTIKSEDEVPALCQQFGVALTLSDDQKACLQQGGSVTLSFSVQQPQQVAAPPVQMVSHGTVMMTPEQAEAFKKANGGQLIMTPEQAAAFAAANGQ